PPERPPQGAGAAVHRTPPHLGAALPRGPVAGGARTHRGERVAAARILERGGLPARAQAVHGRHPPDRGGPGGAQLRARPLLRGLPALGAAGGLMRGFRDRQGRAWDAVVGRESWGAFFAIFVPAEAGGELRQAQLQASTWG